MATKKDAPVKNQVVALSMLKPHDRNYQRHPDSQIADLQESLRQFSQVRSIVVQANGGKHFTILAGHGLVQAAQREGFKELRADIVPASWSKTKALAYLSSDNELARHGDPDQEQLAQIIKDVLEAEGEVLARLAAGEQSALDTMLAQGTVPNIEFKEYGENTADDVKYCECPKCGHKFPA